MNDVYTDPVTGRHYTVDPATGQSRWLDEVPPSPAPSGIPDYGTPESVAPGPGYPGATPAAQMYPPDPGAQPNPGPSHGQWGQPEPGVPGQQYPAYPAPSPYAYPGQQPPPFPQPGGSSSRTGLIIGLVALVVVVLGGVGTAAFLLTRDDSKDTIEASSSGTTQTSDDPDTAETSGTTTVTVNSSVDVSYFEITVTQIEYGYEQVKNEDIIGDAEGQFAIVSFSVTNTDSYPHFFLSGYETATDSNGTTVEAVPSIYFYDLTNDPFGQDLRQGDTASGVIGFDIPRDATLSTITFEYLSKTGTVTVGQ